MMRTWTLRGLTALLTLAVAVPMLRAAPPSESLTTEDRLTLVLDQLRDVRSRLAEIQDNQLLQIKSMQGDIDRLKEEMRRLTDEMHRLSVAPPTIAASINPNPPATPLVTGTIQLENRYSYPATVFINNQSYRLNPFERRSVAEPAGRFNYSVYTDNYGLVQGVTDRYLSPGRDFPITINP